MLDFFRQHFLSKSLIRSFTLSDLSKSLTVAHLSGATWAICSRLLISSERPAEQFAHGCSFVLSNLRESLTVPHLIWAKWGSEQMRNEQMSEFPAMCFCELYIVYVYNKEWFCKVNVVLFFYLTTITLHFLQFSNMKKYISEKSGRCLQTN